MQARAPGALDSSRADAGHGRILDGIDIYLLDPGLVQPMLSELGLIIAVGPEPELR